MRRTSVLMATIMTIGVFIAAAAFAGEPPADRGHAPSGRWGGRYAPEGPMPTAIMMLVRYQEIDVISELTGLTKENVRQLLISSPPPAILEAYGVPFETFRSAMDKRALRLVKQAQTAGIITKKQADEIQKRMALKIATPADMGDAQR